MYQSGIFFTVAAAVFPAVCFLPNLVYYLCTMKERLSARNVYLCFSLSAKCVAKSCVFFAVGSHQLRSAASLKISVVTTWHEITDFGDVDHSSDLPARVVFFFNFTTRKR